MSVEDPLTVHVYCKSLKIKFCASFFLKLELHSPTFRSDADFTFNGN